MKIGYYMYHDRGFDPFRPKDGPMLSRHQWTPMSGCEGGSVWFSVWIRREWQRVTLHINAGVFQNKHALSFLFCLFVLERTGFFFFGLGLLQSQQSINFEKLCQKTAERWEHIESEGDRLSDSTVWREEAGGNTWKSAKSTLKVRKKTTVFIGKY